MTISIIAAMSANRAIGFRGALPWHIPEDLARFRLLTTGHTVIMGRKTFESLPHGALPNRRNIVLSHNFAGTHSAFAGCDTFSSLTEALASCNGTAHDKEEVFIIGGASVYQQALPLANRLYLTLVDNEPPQADTFFPEYDNGGWRIAKKEKHVSSSGIGFSFIDFVR